MAVVRAGMKRLVELASKRFGVVTRADLGLAEASWKCLRGRLATGEWNRVHRGVYRLGCKQPDLDEREMAALLAAGDEAVLSHLSAARRHGLDLPRDDSVHITIPARRKAKIRGAKVWRSRSLRAGEVTTHRRFRITSLARTILDLAAILDDHELRVALDSAVRNDRSNVKSIFRLLAWHGPGCRGIGRLRSLLEEYRHGGEVPDSALERLAFELAKATGHQPRLQWKVRDRGRQVAEVDLAWPEVQLCIEVDGWAYHSSRDAFVRDRARDRALMGLGWMNLRYTSDDLRDDAWSLVENVRRMYQSRARSFGIPMAQAPPTG